MSHLQKICIGNATVVNVIWETCLSFWSLHNTLRYNVKWFQQRFSDWVNMVNKLVCIDGKADPLLVYYMYEIFWRYVIEVNSGSAWKMFHVMFNTKSHNRKKHLNELTSTSNLMLEHELFFRNIQSKSSLRGTHFDKQQWYTL